MTTTDCAPLDLDAIAARCAAATPGPWSVDWDVVASTAVTAVNHPDLFSGWFEGHMEQADAIFIAQAREDVPALVAEVRRLLAELAASIKQETRRRT